MSIGHQQIIKIQQPIVDVDCPNPQSQLDGKRYINPQIVKGQEQDLQVQMPRVLHFEHSQINKSKKSKSNTNNLIQFRADTQEKLRRDQNTKYRQQFVGLGHRQENLMISTNFIMQRPEKSLEKLKVIDLSDKIKSIKVSSKEIMPQIQSNSISKQLKEKKVIKRENKKLSLTQRSSSKKIDDSRLFFTSKKCDICCSEVDQKSFYILDCGHQYCEGCLLSWSIQSLKSFKILKCPHSKCNEPIDLQTANFLEKLPQNYKRMLKRYKIYMSILGNDNLLTCPNESCDQGIINIEKIKQKPNHSRRKVNIVFNEDERLQCSKCNSYICQLCFQIDHGGEKCKDFTLKFQQIKQNGGYCKCTNCLKFIEKTQGCNHMTCRCGYQFCFVCNERWRLFHLCNPFNYSEFNKQLDKELTEPKCCDYFEYVSVYIGKCLWAFFAIIYIYPCIILTYILSVITFFFGLILIGTTYGYIYVLRQIGKSNNRNWMLQFLFCLFIFPVGMIKGIIYTACLSWNLLKRLTKAFIRCTDMATPFNWIPFQYL